MTKKEIKSEKELEELKHKNKLIELEIMHKNKTEQIRWEKESRICVETIMHENKMSFLRMRRADDRRKTANYYRDRPT